MALVGSEHNVFLYRESELSTTGALIVGVSHFPFYKGGQCPPSVYSQGGHKGAHGDFCDGKKGVTSYRAVYGGAESSYTK